MPTIMSDQEIDAYAHCPNRLCQGYDQQKIRAQRQEVGTTYKENGGDAPFIESSHVDLSFVNSADERCPHCERRRELSEQARTTYQNLSGVDPEGLIGIKYGVGGGNVGPAVVGEVYGRGPSS